MLQELLKQSTKTFNIQITWDLLKPEEFATYLILEVSTFPLMWFSTDTQTPPQYISLNTWKPLL